MNSVLLFGANVLHILFLFLGATYCVFLFILILGLARTLKRRPLFPESLPPVSVIIPFRNEVAHLSDLLKSIEEQKDVAYELVLVDDGSDDGSNELVRRWQSTTHLDMKLLSSTGSGKKAALQMGISHAKYPMILTTDADCIHSPYWVASMARWFSDPQIQMVAGGVRLNPVTALFDSLQVVEFSALIASGAATLGFGIGTLCNGANLAFRRSAFDRVKGYDGNEHIPGGDDEFLMKKIASHYEGAVVFNSDPASVVSTTPHQRVSAFVNQRLRWASKWRHQSPGAVAMAVLVLLFNVALLYLIVRCVQAPLSIMGIIVLVRIALEGYFLFSIGRFQNSRLSILSFAVWEVLYPVYAVTFGLMVHVFPYTWKGRKYFRQVKRSQ